ncbi:MAG TPA: competence type IV pilus ATPase ComGA [Bacillota bacterium]|nr:competence type IV pilus ATPase ComGA [Bacillota bacterium]
MTSAVYSLASDIHFYPFSEKTNIFFRINGIRVFQTSISTTKYQLLLTYYKFTAGMDIGETRRPQNGTITYQTNSKRYALRLSTLPINQMESMTIRILPQEDNYALEDLFLFPQQLERIKSWMTHRSGMILFTGPTGSGKTTTLYALLESLMKNNAYQTITLEDPIEKDINNILQVQVNEQAGITYQTGLKAALRHDPDIIMIGEIRDAYTAQFVLEASMTGHLVLSTLHAKNALGTIYRLLDMGIKRTDLQQFLIAVAALDLLTIQAANTNKRRAAILELLDGTTLEHILKQDKLPASKYFHTFNHLRKKAYAYGFISEETFHAKA